MSSRQQRQNTFSGSKDSNAEKGVRLCKGNDKVIAGVCSGIARYLEVDVVVARVTAIVLLICTVGLAAIAYLICALVLPKEQRQDHLLDVNPVSIASDRYQEVVEAPRRTNVKTRERYGVHADAGHVPPVPPQGRSQTLTQSHYIAYRHTDARRAHEPDFSRTVLVVANTIAMTALFVAVASSLVARNPEWELIDFWPALFIVVGTTVLICFYDRVSLAIRLCGLLFCLELCALFLPFTLGICPPYSLERITYVPLIFGSVGGVCLIVAISKHLPVLFVITVVLFGIALVCFMVDVGLLERLMLASSYSRHNFTSYLFRL